MILQHIRIEHFGSVSCFEQRLTPGLNRLCTRHTQEVVTALDFLLCRTPPVAIPSHWLRADTRLSALVCLEEGVFRVIAAMEKGQLQLFAPEDYPYAMTHNREQDDLEHFDGLDLTLPHRLCRYRSQPSYLAAPKTAHAHLRHYIKNFRPQPINNHKSYRIGLDREGNFYPFLPGYSGAPYLSETEQRLFLYTCFLNLAEFWTDLETLRDLHHEKKPLLVYNFLEHLDESTDLQSLINRTQNLSHQTLFLLPFDGGKGIIDPSNREEVGP